MRPVLPPDLLNLLEPLPVPHPWHSKDTAPTDGSFFIGLVNNPWEVLQSVPMILQYHGRDAKGQITYKPPLLQLQVSHNILAGWLELIQHP